MAKLYALLVPVAGGATAGSVNASTATAEVTFGANEIISFNASQDVTISFGATSAVPTPTTSDYRVPANTVFTFVTSRNTPCCKILNLSGTTAANYYFLRMSQF